MEFVYEYIERHAWEDEYSLGCLTGVCNSRRKIPRRIPRNEDNFMTDHQVKLDRVKQERMRTRYVAELKQMVQDNIVIDCLDYDHWIRLSLIIHQLRQEGVHGPFAELRKVWE